MGQILRWLKKVPIWVWLFIAVSQVLTLIARINEIPDIDQAIQKFGDQPAYAEIKSKFEEYREVKMGNLIAAAILAPLSIGLAFWKWSSRDSSLSHSNEDNQDVKATGEGTPEPLYGLESQEGRAPDGD